jgi:uncharacterized membrane protein YbhN (UPF0104 family)
VSPLAGAVLAAGAAVAVAVAWAVLRRRGVLGDLKPVATQLLRRAPGGLALTVLLTACYWGCRYSVVIAVAASVGAQADPRQLFFLQWFVSTAITLTPTPGAALGAETAFFAIYRGLLPEGTIGVATAAWRFLTFYLLVLVAAGLLVATASGRPVASGAAGPAAPRRGRGRRSRASGSR